MLPENTINRQEGSLFFSRLPVEVRHQIYTADEAVLKAIETTCRFVHTETDVRVQGKSVETDTSPWSVIRRRIYPNASLPQLNIPRSAKWVCKQAAFLQPWQAKIAQYKSDSKKFENAYRKELNSKEKEVIMNKLHKVNFNLQIAFLRESAALGVVETWPDIPSVLFDFDDSLPDAKPELTGNSLTTRQVSRTL